MKDVNEKRMKFLPILDLEVLGSDSRTLKVELAPAYLGGLVQSRTDEG